MVLKKLILEQGWFSACAINVYITAVMAGNYCLHSHWGLLVLITVLVLANDIEVLY